MANNENSLSLNIDKIDAINVLASQGFEYKTKEVN